MQTPKLNIVPSGKSVEQTDRVDLDSAYRIYAPYVARVAMRVLGSRQGVDDIVQDVFLEAHRGIEKLNNPEALKGWLVTITVRKVRKNLRRRAFLRAVGWEKSCEPLDLEDKNFNPVNCGLLAAAYRILDTLPTSVRIAWILKHVEGESLERVAELTNCSRATAHRRTTLAKNALAEAFDDEQ